MATLSDLTEREIEILQLVLAGKTNKEIAFTLSVTDKTVEFHLGKIYTKIGMRTRMLAGIWAMQQRKGDRYDNHIRLNHPGTRDYPACACRVH